DFTKDLEIDPKDEDAYYWRGRSRREVNVKDFKGAIADFTSALELSKNTIWQYWRGRTYYETGDLDHALDDLNACIKADAEFASAYLYRGLTLLRQGKAADADKDLEQSLKLDPDLKSALEDEKQKVLKMK